MGGITAGGGLIRDEIGLRCGGFLMKLGKGSALVAELWGALMGLQLAWKRGATCLILEVDSRNVMEIL